CGRRGRSPRRRGRGGAERTRPSSARRRRPVGRGRAHRRGALGAPGRGAGARGRAPGIPPLHPAGRQRARPACHTRAARPGCGRARPALRRPGPRMTVTLVLLNLGLVAVFVVAMRKSNLLGYAQAGKWYLTWLSIGVITLMDELTSVFYAPAEAHRFIGLQAIFFIAFTSILMRFLSSRMVEIAQILERNWVRGGGVYSFSYLVLGPVASF